MLIWHLGEMHSEPPVKPSPKKDAVFIGTHQATDINLMANYFGIKDIISSVWGRGRCSLSEAKEIILKADWDCHNLLKKYKQNPVCPVCQRTRESAQFCCIKHAWVHLMGFMFKDTENQWNLTYIGVPMRIWFTDWHTHSHAHARMHAHVHTMTKYAQMFWESTPEKRRQTLQMWYLNLLLTHLLLSFQIPLWQHVAMKLPAKVSH